MKAILTIDDLLWAQENNPSLVEECLSQVTIMEGLEKYLLWLYQEEVTVKVTTELRRRRSRTHGIHPSSACKKGVCLLKLYYECTGELDPKRAYEQATFANWDIGTLLHDTYQTYFGDMYEEQFTDEVKLVDEVLHIKSRTDGLFNFPVVRFVLEAKSIKEGGNYGWAKVQQKPQEDNVRQSHFYMKLSDSPFALIFYMNKNKGLLKEHAVVFDPELWSELEDEIVAPVVNAAFNDGPAVQASPGYGCRWCDFNHCCKAANKERTHVKGSSKPWGRKR